MSGVSSSCDWANGMMVHNGNRENEDERLGLNFGDGLVMP